jgi:predicted aminopeptidase
LVRAAWEEGSILARRRPISTVIANPSTTPAERAQLELVVAARAFAADSLGLRAKQSFTTYTRLDRPDTLVLVLSAAYRDWLVPYGWWFPIVGRVPYKGFFDFDGARRAAAAMRDQGFDAHLSVSPAFSTLGFFNDPLLSTSLGTDSVGLANTVIHELTHNTYYAPGEATFNESFANFVGSRGSAAFFRARGSSAAAAEAEARWSNDTTLGRFWTRVYTTLDSAFRAHPTDRAARLAARDTIYARARATLVDSVGPQLGSYPKAYLARVRFDNAALLARRVYFTGLDQFDAVFARCGGDLRRAVVQIIAIARGDRDDPYSGMARWLADPGRQCGQ